MAVTIVQQNSGSTGSGTSVTATLASGTTAENILLIIVGSSSTITDPSGFSVDASQDGSSAKVRLYRKTSAAGETSWPITLSAAYGAAWWAAEVSGLSATPLDVTAGASGASASPSTGTTATTAQAEEWAVAAFAVFGVNAVTFSAWTNSFTEQADLASNGTFKNSLGVGIRSLTSIDTYSAGATMSASSGWCGAIATYKTPAAPTSTTRFLPFFT